MAGESAPKRALQLRVLPAQDARGRREAARDAQAARTAQAHVLLGHVRRGRLDARGNARDGARDPRRRPPRGAAPVVRGVHAREPARGDRGSTRRTASTTSSRCAATCRRASPWRANCATPRSSCASSARRRATGSTSRSAAYPECHPQARKPDQDLAAFKAKIDAGANGAITQYFYNADAYFHFVDRRAGRRHRRADRARHHAHQQLHPARALFRRLRRGDPALDAPEARGLRATTPPRSRPSASTW